MIFLPPVLVVWLLPRVYLLRESPASEFSRTSEVWSSLRVADVRISVGDGKETRLSSLPS